MKEFKGSSWVGLATVAVVLLLLVILAALIAPDLIRVMGTILFGIAAVISAIAGRRFRRETRDPDQEADTTSQS